MLARQCMDSLDTYGLDAEALKNRQKAFVEVLKEYKIEIITKAFWKYLQDNKKIPTPADIREICSELSHKAEPKAPPALPAKKIIKQQIRDWATDDIIDVYPHGEHLSPFEVGRKYAGQRVYVRMAIE